MSSAFRHGITPKLRPLSARKSAILSVLDIGTTKVACLVARLDPTEPSRELAGRSHSCRVLGIGHQRSRGLKGGVVVDLEEAERSIRLAVDAAERMAGVQIESVIVNMTGGRLGSQHFTAQIAINGRAVAEADLNRVMEAATAHSIAPGRSVLHSLPTGYALDSARGVRDPKGMIGDRLGVDMHVVAGDAAAARNVLLAVERCHLGVEAMVSTPYASGLSVLIDDEAEMGVACIDLGGGTTSLSVFAGSTLVHADAIAVGGHHVTMDIARGLNTRLGDAERIKALSGSCIDSLSDDREIICVPQVGEEDRDTANHVQKTQLTRIVKPRVEEVLELIRDRLRSSGFAGEAGRRLVLTGGASQLTGLPELARRIISKQVRIGRPVGVQGLPESAKSPAFAAAVGLLVYPQVAALEHFEAGRGGAYLGTGTDGYFSRVGRWLKESF